MWVGEENAFELRIVLCFGVYFYSWKIQDIVNVYKEAAGMWDKDKWRPIFAATFNLALNIILVRYIGLYGILLSSIASFLLVGLPWASHVLFKQYFERSCKEYYLSILGNFGITSLICGLTYVLCKLIKCNGLIPFVCRVVICVVVPNTVFFLVHIKNESFRRLKTVGLNIFKKNG